MRIASRYLILIGFCGFAGLLLTGVLHWPLWALGTSGLVTVLALGTLAERLPAWRRPR